MDDHAGRVHLGKKPWYEVRVAGVEAFQWFSADPDEELRRRRPERYAVVQDSVSRNVDALLDQRHDRWVSPLFHPSTVARPPILTPSRKCRTSSGLVAGAASLGSLAPASGRRDQARSSEGWDMSGGNL